MKIDFKSNKIRRSRKVDRKFSPRIRSSKNSTRRKVSRKMQSQSHFYDSIYAID